MKELLLGAADAIAEAVASFRGDAGAVVGTGSSGQPTQAIDRVAEEAALAFLKEREDDLNVLSEEIGFVDRGGSRTLVLDPVDGTYNATRGLPLYAASLAVGGDRLSTVTHALVRDLTRGDAYYAEKGKGAYLNGGRIRTRPFRKGETLFSVYLGKNAAGPAWDVARSARRVRSLGSAALDLCGVAAGAFDLYYMNSRADFRLRIVDIAAGALLVREAGGAVLDLRGRELDMPFDIQARTNLVAAGDRKVLEVLP